MIFSIGNKLVEVGVPILFTWASLNSPFPVHKESYFCPFTFSFSSFGRRREAKYSYIINYERDQRRTKIENSGRMFIGDFTGERMLGVERRTLKLQERLCCEVLHWVMNGGFLIPKIYKYRFKLIFNQLWLLK